MASCNGSIDLQTLTASALALRGCCETPVVTPPDIVEDRRGVWRLLVDAGGFRNHERRSGPTRPTWTYTGVPPPGNTEPTPNNTEVTIDPPGPPPPPPPPGEPPTGNNGNPTRFNPPNISEE